MNCGKKNDLERNVSEGIWAIPPTNRSWRAVLCPVTCSCPSLVILEADDWNSCSQRLIPGELVETRDQIKTKIA